MATSKLNIHEHLLSIVVPIAECDGAVRVACGRFHTSLALGSFSLPLEEAVYEVNLLTVWHVDERCSVAELHRCGQSGVERRPVGESFAVGVACLSKVHPVLLHHLGHGSFCGILVGLVEESAVQIKYIVGM